MRWVVSLLLIAGCRQILGIDPAVVVPDDGSIAPIDADATVDADLSPRKKEIRVDPSLVAASLNEFPLWISITDPEIAARARTDGTDIHFRTTAGTPLSFERVYWDPQTGHYEAWVAVDLSTALVFDIHYGHTDDPAVAPDSTEVFQNYDAVWHLDDNLATTTISDASGSHDGTATMLGAANRVAGKLRGGIQMNSVEQRITFTNPIIGSGSHTISAWIKLGAVVDYDPVVILGQALVNRSRWFHARFTQQVIGVGMYGNDFVTPFELMEAEWALVHWVYNRDNRMSTVYVNGTTMATYQHANGINTTGSAGYLGYAPALWGPNLNTESGMDGVLDEVRIQTQVRGAAWIAAEYRTQSDPSQTFELGPETMP
ncbi:MAG: LamG-like jellyroll fold domain-containing protein [Kofleriaceae bacterium]